MTLEDICTTYNVTRLIALTKLAHCQTFGGKYMRLDVERVFAPKEQDDARFDDDMDDYYEHLRKEGW